MIMAKVNGIGFGRSWIPRVISIVRSIAILLLTKDYYTIQYIPQGQKLSSLHLPDGRVI